jgi:hypothetical protein
VAEAAGFAKGSVWDLCPPSAALALAAEEASGPEWRCPGGSDDELMGLLCRWAAIESWAAAAKLGVIREMMRREDQPWLGGRRHGDLPDVWSESLQHELAAALAVSAQSADKTAWLAWELGARLPGIAALLADGMLTYAKARLVAEEFRFLSDDGAAQAEAMILDQLPERLTRRSLSSRRGPPAPLIQTVPRSGASTRRRTTPGSGSGVSNRERRRWPAATCRPTRPWQRTRT